MKIIFIRHGKTAGNLEKRYIGVTDEPLCEEGVSELKSISYPDCDIVISSPMKRCLQTAEIIYPDKKIVVGENLKECDFGNFEGKNYIELSGNADYQRWIDSGGTLVFPNGEAPADFKKRCIAVFDKTVSEYAENTVLAFVVHGGTIMSILEKYAYPKGGYYDFQVQNAHGYITEFDGKKIIISEKI
ncbi:MAG: histidine phosphatase family protein [Ruminococcus sp.]|nr:histidine phosphatase family protein [Ruminococcus sp.]